MKKHKHKHKKHKHHKHPNRTRKPQTAPHRKTHPLRAGNRSKTKGRATPRRSPSPRAVHRAIHRLLDTTNHIQARAAELENALEALREQERRTAVKQLLLALRNSPDGDLLRSNPAAAGDAANSTAQAIIGALVEAFSIVPVRNIGERIPSETGTFPTHWTWIDQSETKWTHALRLRWYPSAGLTSIKPCSSRSSAPFSLHSRRVVPSRQM